MSSCNGHNHSHHHHHHHNHGKRLGWVIFFNVFITICQAIAGFVSGSLALLSDSVHNLSDVVSLLVSYFAEKLSRRASTVSETFGYKRAEIIAALINALTLLIVAVLISKEAVERFFHPEPIDSFFVIFFAGLGLLVNGASVLLLKREDANLNVRSAYLHMLSDALTSLVVMVAGAVMYYFNIFWLDSLLSIIISCFFVYSSWGLLMATLKVIMHFTPDHIDVAAVVTEVMTFPEVQNVHHIHIWQLTDKTVHFEAHIDFKEDLPLSSASTIIGNISKRLQDKFEITHTMIQPEIGVDDAKSLISSECSLP